MQECRNAGMQGSKESAPPIRACLEILIGSVNNVSKEPLEPNEAPFRIIRKSLVLA